MAKRKTKKIAKKVAKTARAAKRAKATGKRSASSAKVAAGSRKKAKSTPAKTAKRKPKSVTGKREAASARRSAAGSTGTASKSKKRRPSSKSASADNPRPAARMSVQLGTERIELADEGKRVPKTKLTKKQLRDFTEALLVKRRELVGDVMNLTDQALSGNSASGGGSHMPIHMADVGSDNWEQEFTLGLIENERSLVREIDEALQRIENRTYGVCLATHRPIDEARLRAKPWAKYCIEYARLRELGRVP